MTKIEPAEGDGSRTLGPPFVDGESALFLGLNRNKESLILDYTRAEGLARLHALVRMADVLVVNMLPAEHEARQVTYAALFPLNPRLISCAMTFLSRLSRPRKASLRLATSLYGGSGFDPYAYKGEGWGGRDADGERHRTTNLIPKRFQP